MKQVPCERVCHGFGRCSLCHDTGFELVHDTDPRVFVWEKKQQELRRAWITDIDIPLGPKSEKETVPMVHIGTESAMKPSRLHEEPANDPCRVCGKHLTGLYCVNCGADNSSTGHVHDFHRVTSMTSQPVYDCKCGEQYSDKAGY